jgi:hypothetical protein
MDAIWTVPTLRDGIAYRGQTVTGQLQRTSFKGCTKICQIFCGLGRQSGGARSL